MSVIFVAACAENGGIYTYYFDDGHLSPRGFTPLDRPMYLLREDNRLYVLQKDLGDGFGGLTSFEILPDGRLGKQAKTVSTRGIEPCHLCSAFDNIYVANYGSGSIFSTDGSLVVDPSEEKSNNRQERSHTHFIEKTPDENALFCVDLGIDKILTYDKNLSLLDSVCLPDGTGPRHLCYASDGKTVFSANELGSSVSIFAFEGEKLRHLTTVPAADVAFTGDNYPAAIRYADGHVFVSNRGEDTVAVFRFDGKGLSFAERFSVGGSWPRDIAIDGQYLLCANERSDDLTVIDLKSADKTPKVAAKLPAPLAILVM